MWIALYNGINFIQREWRWTNKKIQSTFKDIRIPVDTWSHNAVISSATTQDNVTHLWNGLPCLLQLLLGMVLLGVTQNIMQCTCTLGKRWHWVNNSLNHFSKPQSSQILVWLLWIQTGLEKVSSQSDARKLIHWEAWPIVYAWKWIHGYKVLPYSKMGSLDLLLPSQVRVD